MNPKNGNIPQIYNVYIYANNVPEATTNPHTPGRWAITFTFDHLHEDTRRSK